MSDEPVMAIVKLLRAQLTDYNSGSRVGTNWIYPGWPRVSGDGALSKNSYPRISIITISETGEPACIGATDRFLQTITLQIDVWVWAREGDTMILTISEDTYEGTKLRDKLVRDVIDALRDNFYTDDNTCGIYSDLMFTGARPIDFDEAEGILRKLVEIEFTKIQT